MVPCEVVEELGSSIGVRKLGSNVVSFKLRCYWHNKGTKRAV